MKKQFWFIILFGVWCLLSALWYFLSVKGVMTEPKGFNSQSALIAIIEILVMLLVACLLGYAIAWYFRTETIDDQNEKLEAQREENNLLGHARDDYKNQVELWREKYRHDLNAVQQKSSDLISEREKLQKHKIELESSLMESGNETQEVKSRLQQVETEMGTLRYRNRQLEFQVKEAEESNSKLKTEISERNEKKSVSDHPFVRPMEPDDKDDLTKIKGVGPFIEKRLNMIGIYTFQQMAELSPEMVDRVGAAIEFFPSRIIRDNWVGQARSFSRA